MIKDLQLLKYPELLYEKKCVIWGCGKNGLRIYKNLVKLGIDKEELVLCDSHVENVNTKYSVLNIEQMIERVAMNRDEYMIIISVESTKDQDDIIEQIKMSKLFDVDIYTLYAAKWGIVLANRKKGIDIQETKLGIIHFDQEIIMMQKLQKKLHYFMLALYLDQILIVHQPGKVGSTTICSSLENYNVYSLHLHNIQNVESIKEVMQKRNGKIISVVRNPLEWKISLFWEMFETICLTNRKKDFFELQRQNFSNAFVQQEFRWYEHQMKEALGIDIFDYPFDKERGYTIIKKDNMELLLMTCEKLNSLEDVIGEFVGVSNFKLENSNVANRKDYRYVYEQYKKEFLISKNILESICEDKNVKYFYTEDDIRRFYQKWEHHIIEHGEIIGVE